MSKTQLKYISETVTGAGLTLRGGPGPPSGGAFDNTARLASTRGDDVPRGTQLNRGGLVKKPKEMEHGGMAYDVTHGSEDVPMEWGRKKLDSGTEQLIQGTEFQVRGRYFNNNDGKGTF